MIEKLLCKWFGHKRGVKISPIDFEVFGAGGAKSQAVLDGTKGLNVYQCRRCKAMWSRKAYPSKEGGEG